MKNCNSKSANAAKVKSQPKYSSAKCAAAHKAGKCK